jgi:hypothetical protein
MRLHTLHCARANMTGVLLLSLFTILSTSLQSQTWRRLGRYTGSMASTSSLFAVRGTAAMVALHVFL